MNILPITQRIGFFGLAVGLLLSSSASAQLAPVVGSHYAARPTDTGFESAVNSQGGYGASIPLDLPAARGGLPKPLSVVYGGTQVGAAGMGWDVPLSFIERNTTTARRRPAPQLIPWVDVDIPLIAPERLSLSLMGEHTDLVRNGADTAWVGRRGNTQVEVRSDGNGKLVMYDGNGLTYAFTSRGGASSSVLDNGDFYLLRDITGPGGTRMHLEYGFDTLALPGGASGQTINLESVSYNEHPDRSCFKHRILLNYDNPAAGTTPLTMSLLNHAVLARVQKLISIDVTSKATCAAASISLRKYTLTYQSDVDTQRPQLQNVKMVGQQGTPERTVVLPVATYSYGGIVDAATSRITYQKTYSVPRPSVLVEAADFAIGPGYTFGGETDSRDGSVLELYTAQVLLDFDGDGRPEFSRTGSGDFRNLPGPNGTVVFGTTPMGGSNGSVTHVDTIRSTSIQPDRGRIDSRYDAVSVNETLRQRIDMNGDGRLDFIEVAQDGDHWIVNLNTPDPANLNNRIFVPFTIPTDGIRTALQTTGRAPNTITLARRTTVAHSGYTHCWEWKQLAGRQDWVERPQTECLDLAPIDRRQKTITEFELRDINGDGYPDFVYNASFVRERDPVQRPAAPGTTVGQRQITQLSADLIGPRHVKVLMNVAGAHLANGAALFASPHLLEIAGAEGCGIARWEPDSGSASGGVMNEVCGFEDVSGDGIVDRVTSAVEAGQLVTRAALGTGDIDHPFVNGATITLPGPLARTVADLVAITDTDQPGRFKPRTCGPAHLETFYESRRTRGLRDVNGDGISDYIAFDGSWTVSLGTGTGFTSARGIDSPVGMELSIEKNSCELVQGFRHGRPGVASTPIGIYDMDGDGQPEIVTTTNTGNWDVYQLRPPVQQIGVGTVASVPAAGRLTRIDHGYGAATRIGYQSAKEDPTTPHQVPYPEIVVTAVATTATDGGLLAATQRYAYGGAAMIFDAAQDIFTFRGYGRSVSLITTDAVAGVALARFTDTYGLAPFVTSMDATARFARYLKVGLVSDVTTLSGALGTDPWTLLNQNLTNDTKRIAGVHYDWAARLLPAGPAPEGNESCVDMMFPYEFTASRDAWLGDDQCTAHGFVFQQSSFSWRGRPGADDPFVTNRTVKTSSEVEAVDDFGRVTRVVDDGDLSRADDDVCTQTTYAEPMGSNERLLNAPASQTTTNCGQSDATRVTLAQQSWEYDTTAAGVKLPTGRIAAGFITSQTVSRRNTTTGAPIVDANGSSDIRLFDAIFDVNGNPISVVKTRDDGASQTVTTVYDPFGLLPISMTVDATNPDGTKPPQLTSAITSDPITLNTLSTTDPNEAVSSNTYDGFSRVVLSKVKPAGGSEGVMSMVSYAGFEFGQTGGRRIVQKVFADPVTVANVGTTVGRTSTVFLDSLGREQSTEVALGADYADKKLIVGQRIYDLLGRVLFEADPFSSTDSFATAYGTTQHFNGDGTPSCTIRGRGVQGLGGGTNETQERYPTCYGRSFFGNKEIVVARDALTNLGVNQMEREAKFSAIGRLLESSTTNAGVSRFEFSEYAYDGLGHMKSMTRFQTPAGNPVATTWHYDSLGQVIRLEEAGSNLATPVNAPQNRTYSSWGELTQVQWDDPTIAGDGNKDRRTVMKYDALGRLIHSEDQTKGSVDVETTNDYVYDQAFNITTPPVTATNVLGRMTRAIAPTSTVAFSYDGLGRINARTFTDTSITPTQNYVQKHDFHADGSLLRSHLLLPDNGFKDEKIDYSYDSAGRTRSVKYDDGTTRDLFVAPGADDLDVFGRIRSAKYGQALYTANYAETGRRLPSSIKVTSPGPMTTSREIAFPVLSGTSARTTPFDPLGRERVRRESRDGVASPFATMSTYNLVGQLEASSKLQVSTGVMSGNRAFAYDPLGNLLTQTDTSGLSPSAQVTMSYQDVDRDRICSIGYGATTPPATCNVKYDGVGNITEMPTRSSGLRTFTYYANGQTKTIVNGATNATYKYDAFGDVQQLDVNSPTSADTRRDKHFGAMLSLRKINNVATLDRKIPAPGLMATRHGKAGGWTFAFGEQRGNRFFTDHNGAFVQDVDYQPYGEVKDVSGALPGTPNYTREQWNGGDALAALGVTQLGARIYDPVIGRFLSRDPLIIPRTAATTNPYAFAMSDPVNLSDPSGLDPRDGPPKKCENCKGSEVIIVDGGNWTPPPPTPTRAPTTYRDMGGNYGTPGSGNGNGNGSSGSAKSTSGRSRSGAKGVCSSGTVTCSIEKYVGRPTDPEKLKQTLQDEKADHDRKAREIYRRLMELAATGHDSEELRDQYHSEAGQVYVVERELARLEKSMDLRTYMPELNRERPELPEFGALDEERAADAAAIERVKKYFEEKARRIPDKPKDKRYDPGRWRWNIHLDDYWNFDPSIMSPRRPHN